MPFKLDIVGETGLQFYGKMSASMSHEIKNVLSVIQEHAGLLEDFAVMAEQGGAIEPQRVTTLATKIQGQIERANGIVKGMNQLAHSVDEPVKSLDLGQTLTLLVALSQRFASVRGVRLEPTLPSNAVTVTSSPFILQNLAWLCLDFAMQVAGNGKVVRLSVQPAGQGAQLKFSQLEGLGDKPAETFPGEQEKALLQALNAEVEMRIGEIVVTLPGDPTR